MRHPVIRIYPDDWRERYGEEIEDLLDRSDRPIRDFVDVAVHAIGKRMENLMQRYIRLIRAVAMTLAAVSLVAFGYALDDLAGGITEVAQHWWSTIPILGFAISGAMLLIARGLRSPVNGDRDS
jgi:hypothetical protein